MDNSKDLGLNNGKHGFAIGGAGLGVKISSVLVPSVRCTRGEY